MGDREEGRKADEVVSVQDYAHMVERRLALIRLTKAKLDDWLSIGRSKYMDDECLVNLEKERDILFGVELKETCKEARMSADQDLMKCANREHILPDSVDDASLTDLEAQLPDNLTVTQILDQVETFDIVMNTALKNAGYVATSSGYFRNKNDGSQLGSFSNESELMQPNTMVGSETTNMKNVDVNEHRSNTEKTPEATIGFLRIRDPVSDVMSMPIVYPKSLNEHQLSRMAMEREKRDQKLPSVMRSPWFDRVVKVNKEVSIIEKRVFSWLSTHDGDENEVIFETTKGIQGWKGVMETLTFGSMVHANVIDIWAYILNDLERRRDPNGPARAFFKTGMLRNTMLDKSRTFPEIYDQFHGNLKDCIVRYNIGDLKNIDLSP